MILRNQLKVGYINTLNFCVITYAIICHVNIQWEVKVELKGKSKLQLFLTNRPGKKIVISIDRKIAKGGKLTL